MIAALKEHVIPLLREKQFKGSYPHFRRITESQIDLLTFQFDKYGGGFVVEVSNCPADGFKTYWGEHIEPKKVKAHDTDPNDRIRLGPKKLWVRDYWFRFEKKSWFAMNPHYEFTETAKAVIPYIEVEAETFWADYKTRAYQDSAHNSGGCAPSA